MSINYDPAVMQQFADRLYRQAKFITASYATTGAVLLGGAMYALTVIKKVDSPWWIAGALVGALLFGNIGYRKAFMLRLKAQRTLCQMKIAEKSAANEELLKKLFEGKPKAQAASVS